VSSGDSRCVDHRYNGCPAVEGRVGAAAANNRDANSRAAACYGDGHPEEAFC